MKPIAIDHANVFDDFKDVLVELELTNEDKERIKKFHLEYEREDYDTDDVSVLVWVNVENKEAIGINYAAYYPAEMGERELPVLRMFQDGITEDCVKFVKENYFGNEEEYDC